MNEVEMLRQVKSFCSSLLTHRNSFLSIITVLDSMKDDFAIMQKEMDRMQVITNSWNTLLRGTNM